MNSLDNYPTSPVFTFIGGGTTGETAAGFLDAVESGQIPGIDSARINAIVGSADSGSRSGDLRKHFRLHAVGDFRRTISALSANTYAAPLFESRFNEDATAADVAARGEELLAALLYSDTPVSAERSQTIVSNVVTMSQEVIRRDRNQLKGLSIGHLVVASLMHEHRLAGKGKNAQTALDEASTFMAARGRVITDSLVPHDLEMQDGAQRIFGEAAIDQHAIQNPDEVKVWVTPAEDFSSVPANPTALQAVTEADMVVIGPGSLYTSDIPPLLVEGMPQAMAEAEAKKRPFISIANLVTEETLAPSMSGIQHLKEIERYAGRAATGVVYNHNTDCLPQGRAVIFDRDELERMGDSIMVVAADLVDTEAIEKDPNDPLTNRSKVKTNMSAAAVAAFASASQKELMPV